ncbi:MAG: hypothetical protein IJ272_10055 [Clostridia bacterium]|nr:hypothetical protein [Clostridia bacterium]
MKKFFKIVIITVIIALICLVPKLDILDFFALNISEEKLSTYSEYYFNQLALDEQKMYVRIDEAIKNRQEKVFLGLQETEDITEKISKVLEAYFYDNPEYYYVSNEYVISTSNLKIITYSILELDYITSADDEIDVKNKELEIAIYNLLKECITETMTDFEKELAIHDALVERVNYYEYEDINTIPGIKHTAYGALVENEAVCDGYSKAFKLLLEEAGIYSIIISGSTDNIAHAWNLVKLDDEYYHVDVTSDKLEEKDKKYVVHAYFNVNDEKISKTHVIDENFDYPQCDGTKYEYYTQKGYAIATKDNLYNKLKDIISKQKSSNILELKVTEQYSSRKIIDALYDLNFNNWRSNWQTTVSYNKIEDVYVLVK